MNGPQLKSLEPFIPGGPKMAPFLYALTDTGLTIDNLWNIASDRDAWRSPWPTVGQDIQWVSEWAVFRVTRGFKIVAQIWVTT